MLQVFVVPLLHPKVLPMTIQRVTPWILLGMAASVPGGRALEAQALLPRVVDGNRLSIATSALNVELPGNGWEFLSDSTEPAMLATLERKDGSARVTIQYQSLPGRPLADIVQSIDLSLGLQFEGFEKSSSSDLEIVGTEGYQVEGDAKIDGEARKLRIVFFKPADLLYSILLSAAPGEFDSAIDDFARIVSSMAFRSLSTGAEAGCAPPPARQAGTGTDDGASDASAAKPQTSTDLVPLDGSLAPLQDGFNEGASRTRLVAILSPTCAGCVHAARAIARVLAEFPDAEIAVSIVWVPMLPGDSESAAAVAAARLDDSRVRHLYDGDRRSGMTYSVDVFPGWLGEAFSALPEDHVLHGALEPATRPGVPPQPLWDVVFFYDPAVKWTDSPPRPARLIKQYAFFGRAGAGGHTGFFTRDEFTAPAFASDWYDELRRQMDERFER